MVRICLYALLMIGRYTSNCLPTPLLAHKIMETDSSLLPPHITSYVLDCDEKLLRKLKLFMSSELGASSRRIGASLASHKLLLCNSL